MGPKIYPVYIVEEEVVTETAHIFGCTGVESARLDFKGQG